MNRRSTFLIDLARPAHVRLAAARDERGVALVTALLFMVMLTGLSVVLLSVILGQVGPSYAAQKATRTIYAAQGGLQAGLGVLRSAAAAPDKTGAVYGSIAKLPCTIAGKVDGVSADLKYEVTFQYFTLNPEAKDDAWLNANDMNCSSTAGVSVQPNYAVITSRGVGAASPGQDAATGNRALAAIYKFRVSNVNVPGGRIYDYDVGFCLQAESATLGAEVKYVPASQCNDANEANQLWIYDVDWKIKLANSTVAPATTPLCITAPSVDPKGVPSTGNQNVKLQLCQSPTAPARWNQLWSWVGQNSWLGENQAITDTSSWCLGPAAALANGVKLQAKSACGAFAPTPALGAGAASKETEQMVNYKEFGRCADVTSEQVGSSWMIAYPCKQDPAKADKVLWNHKFKYTKPAAGVKSIATKIVVNYNNSTATSNTYCLTTPSKTASPAYVTLSLCSSTNTNQNWTRYEDTGDYSNSYVFTDVNGRCLGVDQADKNGNWSKLTVTACSGLEHQKWNAPATYNNATFGSYREVG